MKDDKLYIVNTGMRLETLACILNLSIDTVRSYSSGRLKIPDNVKKKLILISKFHDLVRDSL